jgi:hypothetical protein
MFLRRAHGAGYSLGTEADVRAPLAFNVRTIDLHSIEPRRLRYDPRRGVAQDATIAALAYHGLEVLHRRSRAIPATDDANLKQP